MRSQENLLVNINLISAFDRGRPRELREVPMICLNIRGKEQSRWSLSGFFFQLLGTNIVDGDYRLITFHEKIISITSLSSSASLRLWYPSRVFGLAAVCVLEAFLCCGNEWLRDIMTHWSEQSARERRTLDMIKRCELFFGLARCLLQRALNKSKSLYEYSQAHGKEQSESWFAADCSRFIFPSDAPHTAPSLTSIAEFILRASTR